MNRRNVIISLGVSLLILIGAAIGVFVAVSSDPSRMSESTAKSGGDQTYAAFLVSRIETNLDELSTLATSQSAGVVRNVSAEVSTSSIFTTQQEDISEKSSEVESDLDELRILVDNTEQTEQIIQFLTRELDRLENEYQLIVDNSGDATVIIIRGLDDSFEEVKDSLLQRSVEDHSGDELTVTQSENKYRRLSAELEVYDLYYSRFASSLSDFDRSIADAAIQESTTQLAAARTALDSEDVVAAYAALEGADDSLDQLELIFEDIVVEEEGDESLIQIEALEKIINAEKKIQKAESELVEENPSAEVEAKAQELLSFAKELLTSAKESYSQADYPAALSSARESRDQAKLAISIINDNSLDDLDDRKENAEDKIRDAEERLAKAESRGVAADTISYARDLIAQAKSALAQGNYTAAERLAKSAKLVLEGEEEEDEQEDETETEDESDEQEDEDGDNSGSGSDDDEEDDDERDDSGSGGGDDEEDDEEEEEDDDNSGSGSSNSGSGGGDDDVLGEASGELVSYLRKLIRI